jgi:(p)ppGpp synthase/HD superfamily hydrolase
MAPAERLTDWIVQKHKGQLIRRSGEPYFNHLVAVAALAKPAVKLGYEIGLCHDLLEDTGTTENELLASLQNFGYSAADAGFITTRVVELTDFFTAAAFPKLSKSVRKAKEAKRLLTISPEAQTVKYCDLIDNIKWVMQYDRHNAMKYLKKKEMLLVGMDAGDQSMRQMAIGQIHQGLSAIRKKSFLQRLFGAFHFFQ